MHFSSLITAALGAPAVLASTTGRPGRSSLRFGCGAPDPTLEQLEVAASLAAKESRHPEDPKAQTIKVDVYFHVVASSTELSDGYLTDQMLSDQFTVLQDTFAPQGLHFTLKNTTYTIDESWAHDGDELAMKRALRQGSYKTLNIYFLKDLNGYFGYCYFPDNITYGTDDFYYDGCSVLYSTLPGGDQTNYNLGYTVTHEVGHWFGLYHTFQGGCDGDGDYVSDTPAQGSPTSGCPVGRDSCPDQEGLDPITNFMDYSYDTCYEEFTSGQGERIHTYWKQYRKDATEGETDEVTPAPPAGPPPPPPAPPAPPAPPVPGEHKSHKSQKSKKSHA